MFNFLHNKAQRASRWISSRNLPFWSAATEIGVEEQKIWNHLRNDKISQKAPAIIALC